MVNVFIVSYFIEGKRVFHPESMTAKQAQAMGRALGVAKLRPSVHKLVMSQEQAERVSEGRRVLVRSA